MMDANDVFMQKIDTNLIDTLYQLYESLPCQNCKLICQYNSTGVCKCTACGYTLNTIPCSDSECGRSGTKCLPSQRFCMLHSTFSLDVKVIILIISSVIGDAFSHIDSVTLERALKTYNKAIKTRKIGNEPQELAKENTHGSIIVIPFTGKATCTGTIIKTGMPCTKQAKFLLGTNPRCGFHNKVQ